MKKLTLMTALALAGFLGQTQAQIAGTTTTLGITVAESTQVALGWSAKKSILGKTVYNDAGDKVGKVEDLIIAPDKGVSYLIIGAGGFIGLGRHDVAIPAMQVQEQGGKLVMAGATKDTIKSMPAFDFASDSAQRDRFVASAEADIAKAKVKLTELQKKSAEATSDAKAKLDVQVKALQLDMKSAEEKLAELKQATVNKWHSLEASASAAVERLRKSINKATS